MQVRHRNNQNVLSARQINHAIREAIGTTSPCATRQLLPRPRMLENTLNSPYDFPGEFVTQTFSLAIVIANRAFQLSSRWRKKLAFHDRFRMRNFWKTSRTEMAFISPRLYATTRASASSAQSESSSFWFGASRLCRSCSASLARERGGNANATFATFAVCLIIAHAPITITEPPATFKTWRQ